MKFGSITLKNLIIYLLIISFIMLIGFKAFKYLPKSNIEGLTNSTPPPSSTKKDNIVAGFNF